MSMLENIKAAVAKKNSFMEESELLLGNNVMMESMDDSIILGHFTEAEESEEVEIPDTADAVENETSGEETDDLDNFTGDAEDPMSASTEEDEEPDDPMNGEIPDNLETGDDSGEDPVPTGDDPTEEPLPLPGDDLPEPVSSVTGEPVNTDDDIMSFELGMGSSTPRDILPVPPANAGDAIAGETDSIMQGIDSGFGGNSMSDVGPMDGASSIMDTEMDEPNLGGEDPAVPDGSVPTDAGENDMAPAGGEADDLSLESVEEKIKKDVNHEEQFKKQTVDKHKDSAKADKQFGENYLYDMDGHPIEESSEEDDLVFDPFGEASWEIAPEAGRKHKHLDYDKEAKKSAPKKTGRSALLEDDMVVPNRKKVTPKNEGYDFDQDHADPYTEAIDLGGDDSEKKEDAPVQDGGENEVTAAVKDKVDEADGSAEGDTDDLDGGLDFGDGNEDLGGDDLGMGAPVENNGTEATSKTMQMLSKLMGDIAKMQSELASGLVG